MRSASPKPRVIASATRSPLRSSRALVATVVPIRTSATVPPSSRKNATDRFERRIFILAGIVRQQLLDPNSPVGRARDDVGEGAAAVDGEGPAAIHALGL